MDTDSETSDASGDKSHFKYDSFTTCSEITKRFSFKKSCNVIVIGGSSGLGQHLVKELISTCKFLLICCRTRLEHVNIYYDGCHLKGPYQLSIDLSRICTVDHLLKVSTSHLKHKFTENGLDCVYQVNYISIAYLLNNLYNSPSSIAVVSKNLSARRFIISSCEAHKFVPSSADAIIKKLKDGCKLPSETLDDILSNYAISKFCLMAYAYELQSRFKRGKIICCHAGLLFHGSKLLRPCFKSATSVVYYLIFLFFYVILRIISWPFVKTSSQAVSILLLCAFDKRLDYGYTERNYFYFNNGCPVETHSLVYDKQLRKTIFEWTNELIERLSIESI